MKSFKLIRSVYKTYQELENWAIGMRTLEGNGVKFFAIKGPNGVYEAYCSIPTSNDFITEAELPDRSERLMIVECSNIFTKPE